MNKLEEKMGLPRGHFKFLPNIETAQSVCRAVQIATASERNVALLHGGHDLATDLHIMIRHTSPSLVSEAVLVAARAAEILPICSPNCDVDSHSVFDTHCSEAFQSGFAGIITLSPKQVIIANKCFALQPGDRRMHMAQKIVESKNEKVKLMQISPHESRMAIGPPHIANAERILKECQMQQEHDDARRPLQHPEDFLVPKCADSLATTASYELGQEIASPFSITVDQSARSVWDQWFLNCSALCTSELVAKQFGFDGMLIPFSLLMNLAMSTVVIR